MGCLIYGFVMIVIAAYICVALGIEGDSGGAFFIILLCVFGPIAAFYIKNWSDEEKKKQAAEDLRREAARIEQVKNEIVSIVTRFTPMGELKSKQADVFYVDSKYLNRDVIDAARRQKQRLEMIVSKCIDLDRQIRQILDFRGNRTPDEQLAYLRQNSEELKQLKTESDRCHQKIGTHKLQLLNENPEVLFSCKKAMLALLKSDKCKSKSTKIKEFLPENTPQDLALFQYKCAPTTLKIDNFYFCLFSNVILVFDRNGIFSTALDPMALKIQTERKRTAYRFSETVGSDSKEIIYTETRTRWRYACKDGSPDMRYSGNRLIEYQVDVNGYEYGTIMIAIGNHSVEFFVSSSIALDLLDNLSNVYCRSCSHKHNPIPNLLSMLELVSESNDALKNISSIYLPIAVRQSYFCKEVTI